MAKTEYYFGDSEGERCYEIDYWYDHMEDNDLDEMQVYKAEPMPTKDFFWCQEDGEAYENNGESCGSICGSYTPKNGKWGVCKFFKPCYEPIGEPITIKRNET